MASENKYPPQNPGEQEPGLFIGVGLIRSALEFVDKEYLESRIDEHSEKRVAEFLNLLK